MAVSKTAALGDLFEKPAQGHLLSFQERYVQKLLRTLRSAAVRCTFGFVPPNHSAISAKDALRKNS